MAEHGAGTIKAWMEDLMALARSGVDFNTSAGAEPHRNYAYLEFHTPDGEHSMLIFRVEQGEEGPEVRAHRIHGPDDEVSKQVDALIHGE